jgi:hypothetical protein
MLDWRLKLIFRESEIIFFTKLIICTFNKK